jgi:hypothetical protein
VDTQKVIGDKCCRNGYPVGRMLQTSSGEILELYRMDIDYSAEQPEDVDVIGFLWLVIVSNAQFAAKL